MYDAIYRPILRGKEGEFTALKHLSAHARSLVQPIIDIPPAKETVQLDLHVAELAWKLSQSWGSAQFVYVDFPQYEPDTRLADGRHPIALFFECARQYKLKCIPVSGPLNFRGPGTGYTQSVARILHRDRRGCAIRLPFETFSRPELLLDAIANALESNQVPAQEADLVLDAGAIEHLPESEQDVLTLGHTLRDALSVTARWPLRSVTFAGANSSVNSVRQSEQLEVIPRIELMTWRRSTEDAVASRLLFGDYAVVSATQSDPEGPVTPPARVRLSSPAHRYSFRSPRSEYRLLAKQAAEANVFGTALTTWGGSCIRYAAIGRPEIGNPTDWVARDTNLHIEQTARLIEEEMRSRGVFQLLRVADEQKGLMLQPELPISS